MLSTIIEKTEGSPIVGLFYTKGKNKYNLLCLVNCVLCFLLCLFCEYPIFILILLPYMT